MNRLSRKRPESQGFKQAEAEILETIAQTHSSSSEPTGAVRNALLAANRKEIQEVLWSFGVAFCEV